MLYQTAALLLMAIFYACYFIKMLAQRRKGIQTDQMGKGKTGPEQRIEQVLKLMSILTPLSEVVVIALNASMLPAPIRIAGLVMAALGDAVMIAAVLEMKDSWRAGISHDQTKLVTTGVYRISRNPAFLGFDLVYIGVLMAFFHPVLLVITAAAVIAFHVQITRVEEPFLPGVFGQDYLDYCQRVNRYFGVRR